jgi:hypothetical protein
VRYTHSAKSGRSSNWKNVRFLYLQNSPALWKSSFTSMISTACFSTEAVSVFSTCFNNHTFPQKRKPVENIAVSTGFPIFNSIFVFHTRNFCCGKLGEH